MRPTFLLDLNQRPVSAIACHTNPHAMRKGMRVTLSAPFDTGSGTLPANSTGLVTAVDDAEGIVEFTMDGQHGALYLWKNKLIIVPFETEDLIALLRCQAADRGETIVRRAMHSRLVASIGMLLTEALKATQLGNIPL